MFDIVTNKLDLDYQEYYDRYINLFMEDISEEPKSIDVIFINGSE